MNRLIKDFASAIHEPNSKVQAQKFQNAKTELASRDIETEIFSSCIKEINLLQVTFTILYPIQISVVNFFFIKMIMEKLEACCTST